MSQSAPVSAAVCQSFAPAAEYSYSTVSMPECASFAVAVSGTGPEAGSAGGSSVIAGARLSTQTGPTDAELHPQAVTATQKTFTPDQDQVANAKVIVDTAKELNLSPRAAEIAVATSLQEANLHNIGDLGAKNDHDSLGLFQQRPSTGGWGTAQATSTPTTRPTAWRRRTIWGWSGNTIARSTVASSKNWRRGWWRYASG